MKQVLIATVVALMGLQARADGFKCQSESGLNIKVFNHTHPAIGTRTAAIMVISDSAIGMGNRTIATFPESKGVLMSSSTVYLADVDLRMTGSRRAGELIGGTKLGELDQIKLSVNFTYSEPIAAGEVVTGLLTLIKRNGEKIREAVECLRYLKN